MPCCFVPEGWSGPYTPPPPLLVREPSLKCYPPRRHKPRGSVLPSAFPASLTSVSLAEVREKRRVWSHRKSKRLIQITTHSCNVRIWKSLITEWKHSLGSSSRSIVRRHSPSRRSIMIRSCKQPAGKYCWNSNNEWLFTQKEKWFCRGNETTGFQGEFSKGMGGINEWRWWLKIQQETHFHQARQKTV